MNKTRNLVEMGDFYASTVLSESSKKNNHKGIGKDTFPRVGKKLESETVKTGKAFAKAGPHSNENKEVLVKPLEAADTKGKETFAGVEKFTQETGKIQKENINTFMNKSIFDRLFEDVMSDNIHSPADIETADAEALDLPGTEDSVEEGEVTITLDKELAKKLHEVLAAVIGEEEPSEEEGAPEEAEVADEAAEEVEEDEEEEIAAEATELKEVPSSAGHSLTSKSNKVGDETSKLVAKGKGEGKIKDQTDAEGTELPDSKGHTLVGKSNKVASKTSKVGAYLAGLK